jgi:hypothetical protein
MSVVTFAGQVILGSGPKRVVVEPLGSVTIPRLRLNVPVSGSIVIGPAELVVQVRGRLIGPDDKGLSELLADISAVLTDPPTVGTLVDPSGVSYTGMTFVSFERRGWGVGGSARDGLAEVGTVDRGRVVSLAYVARFVRLNPL